jgi:LysM repeat protein
VTGTPTPLPTIAATEPPPTETPPAPSPSPALTLPPTGSPAPTPRPTYRTYTVKPGDTLSGIATKFHTTVSALASLNHIADPSKLHVGQVLKIPN